MINAGGYHQARTKGSLFARACSGRPFLLAAVAIAVLSIAMPTRAQPEIGAMPILVHPMEDNGPDAAWFVLGTWRPGAVPVLIEARHEAYDGANARIPSRLVARPSTGDALPEWAADAARVPVREWEDEGLTIVVRALPDARIAIMWIDLRVDEDDGPVSFRPSAAALVAWDATSDRPTLAESWAAGSGSLPTWLADGLADEVTGAIEAGSLDEAERGLAWLDWVGESRAARRLRASWTRAHDAAERTRRETSIREAIEAGRFDDAERELTAMERDRSARRTARTLRTALADGRAAWFDGFAVGGLHRGMALSEARSACTGSGGTWEMNTRGTTAACDFPHGVGAAVLGINGAVSVGLILDDEGVQTLVVSWTPDTAAQLARLESAVVRALTRVVGSGSDRRALHRGTGTGTFWEVTSHRVVDEMSVTMPAELRVPHRHLLTVTFRAER